MRDWLTRLGLGSGPKPNASEPACIPDGITVYAVGDVHGERRLLEELLAQIRTRADRAGEAPIAIFLGDYVDRGPESRGVIDCLMADPLPGFETRCLMGNHEQALLAFIDDPLGARDWLHFGGIATLMAYGVRPPPGDPTDAELLALGEALDKAIPLSHRKFMSELLPWTSVGDYAFVHAGVRPGVPMHDQPLHDLLWIREDFLRCTRPHQKRIVHGHSIVPAPEVLPNRIGIDTGAYASGVLTAAVLSGSSVSILQSRRASC